MDLQWRAELFSPSSACEVATYQVLEPEQFESEIKDLTQFTKSIALSPYDPEVWLNRAHCLRLLGYPELGLGDAYKSRLLVEAALEKPDSKLGTKAFQTFAKKIYDQHMTDPAWSQWKARVATSALLKSRTIDMLMRLEAHIWTELMEGLIASNCCSDYLRMSLEAVVKFPKDKVFPSDVKNAVSWYQQRVEILQAQVDEGDMTSVQMQTTLENGGVRPTPYPWMTEALLVRDDALIQTIKEEFTLASTNCTVFKSTIRNVEGMGEAEKTTEIDVLGVIASKDITTGETVVTDRTPVGVISSVDRCEACCAALNTTEKITNPCCTVQYCSTECSELALKAYHPSVCGKDFAFLHKAAKSADHTADFSLDSLLLLRILALCLQQNASHPLQTSVLHRLTPAYSTREPQLIILNFADHIVTPILTLRELGVDVFANPKYDTWVLHQIRCRLQNNKHGATLDEYVGSAISPLYSMFNHSCDPNVDWRHDEHSSTVMLFATKDIAEGEEMCISYIKVAEMGREERQKALMPWLGMECGCEKCVREKNLDASSAVEGVEAHAEDENAATTEKVQESLGAEQLSGLGILFVYMPAKQRLDCGFDRWEEE